MAHAFDASDPRQDDRVERFASLTGLQLKDVKSMLISIDPKGIATKVRSKIEKMGPQMATKNQIYVGIATRPYLERFADKEDKRTIR